MDKYREKIALRGTVDCPFQHYLLKRERPNVTLTHSHWHPEYEILYMKSGKIEIKSDKQSFPLSPREIAFISPSRLHSITTLQESSNYYAFVFSLELVTLPQTHFFQKEMIEPLANGTLQLPNVLRTDDPNYNAVASALDDIVNSGTLDPRRKQTIFSSIIRIFMAMFDRLEPCNIYAKHQSNETVKTVLAYLTQHFSESINLQQIADHVHLHPNYLCSLFKDFTGRTVFQHLTGIRIDNAAQLLKTEPIPINEVASRCGFESASFFSKKFKEIMGMSPVEYRHLKR